MVADAPELARRLAGSAEAVCRHYLSSGRRAGRYWLVGDARNNPGRSMFVRLKGPECGKGAAGKWTDAATGEHGDLLDVIRESCGLTIFADVAIEARRFLSLPAPEPALVADTRAGSAARGSAESARRLFAMAQPISGTIAQAYLRRRGITTTPASTALRYHARCYYRDDGQDVTTTWPAMIAAVTDLHGHLTGAHRTWLAPNGVGKAPVATPRRAMGDILGNAVRFGAADDVMAAGEGIETILSLRMALPHMPMAAALSAAHLAGLLLPPTLHRLYIARDNDPAGEAATITLTKRAHDAGIEALVLSSTHGDFNDDLRHVGVGAMRAAIRLQLAPEDVARFMNVRDERPGGEYAAARGHPRSGP